MYNRSGNSKVSVFRISKGKTVTEEELSLAISKPELEKLFK